MLIKPSYQKPVETSEDVIARNLTVISTPGTESITEVEKQSPIQTIRKIAENTYTAKVSLFFNILLICNIFPNEIIDPHFSTLFM